MDRSFFFHIFLFRLIKKMNFKKYWYEKGENKTKLKREKRFKK